MKNINIKYKTLKFHFIEFTFQHLLLYSIYLSIYQSINLSIFLSTIISTYQSIYLGYGAASYGYGWSIRSICKGNLFRGNLVFLLTYLLEVDCATVFCSLCCLYSLKQLDQGVSGFKNICCLVLPMKRF